MDEKIEGKISDIETLKKLKKSLEEDIAKLQVIHNNLDAQAHTAQIKDEQDDKLKDAEIRTKYAVEERRLETKRIEVEGRIDVAETLERKLNDREKEIERRELKTIDLEEKVADLNRQRANFEAYKVGIERELIEAKTIIAEADEAFAKIQVEKDMLIGREAKVKEQEKIWNDEIGKLEAEKKQFQIEKENFIGLGANKKEEACLN